MKSGRFISGCLLAVWLILSTAPAGMAFQKDSCPICNQKSCPMKKMTHPSCNENNQPPLKFDSCSCHKQDTILFTFNLVMPDRNSDFHELITLLPEPFLSLQSEAASKTDPPPPKPLAA